MAIHRFAAIGTICQSQLSQTGLWQSIYQCTLLILRVYYAARTETQCQWCMLWFPQAILMNNTDVTALVWQNSPPPLPVSGVNNHQVCPKKVFPFRRSPPGHAQHTHTENINKPILQATCGIIYIYGIGAVSLLLSLSDWLHAEDLIKKVSMQNCFIVCVSVSAEQKADPSFWHKGKQNAVDQTYLQLLFRLYLGAADVI